MTLQELPNAYRYMMPVVYSGVRYPFIESIRVLRIRTGESLVLMELKGCHELVSPHEVELFKKE